MGGLCWRVTFGMSGWGIELMSALGITLGELIACLILDVEFLVLHPCLLYIPIENIFRFILKSGLPWYSAVKSLPANAGDRGSIPGWGNSLGEGNGKPLQYSWASLVGQLVKNPPAIWETWV